MKNHQNWQQISAKIEQVSHQPFSIINISPVSGGCINSAYIIQSDNRSYFIKLNQPHLLSMFEAEYLGLEELAQTQTIKVPTPLIYGTTDSHAFIVMEKITCASGQSQCEEKMGYQLAELHKVQQQFFGWHINSTIGSTEQINDPTEDWIEFWLNKRLDFQLSLAQKNGYTGQLIISGNKLAESLAVFFKRYNPHPSLLHGDLWSGNASITDLGEPVIYDPACYYGDRETDIAMTELFGGFSPRFYAAYNECYPLHADYPVRKTLYNLYHILNHLNLFGESYLHQAQNMIDSLLSEIS